MFQGTAQPTRNDSRRFDLFCSKAVDTEENFLARQGLQDRRIEVGLRRIDRYCLR